MNLKPGRLDFLMQPENLELLQDILLYHVLPGQKATSDLQAGPTDTLLDGKTVLVGLDPLKFDNSVVRRKDIPSCNGLFNVLDTVLDPCKLKSIGHCCDFARMSFTHSTQRLPLPYVMNYYFSYCVTDDCTDDCSGDEEPFRSTSRGIDGVADGIYHTSGD